MSQIAVSGYVTKEEIEVPEFALMVRIKSQIDVDEEIRERYINEIYLPYIKAEKSKVSILARSRHWLSRLRIRSSKSKPGPLSPSRVVN